MKPKTKELSVRAIECFIFTQSAIREGCPFYNATPACSGVCINENVCSWQRVKREKYGKEIDRNAISFTRLPQTEINMLSDNF